MTLLEEEMQTLEEQLRLKKLSGENGELEEKEEDSLVYTDSNHGNVFLEKLYDLYTREQLCDVKLCVEDNVLCAHRAVLASNSRYFEGMFLGNLLESHQERVTIKEITFDILKSLIDFCYTASITINPDNVLQLLSAANMLQFDGIKQCCCSYLCSKLDAQNCLTIANFADLHTCGTLKESALEFSKKHFRDVVKSDDFLHVTVEQMKSLLESETIVVASELDIFNALVTWIQFDEENRLKCFGDLFQLIRLIDIAPKVLADVIEKHEYVQENMECIKLLSSVKTSLLLPQTHSIFTERQPRRRHSSSKIYLLGGETKRQVFDTVESYCIYDEKWTVQSSMSTPRDGLAAATYDGKIFVAGGYDGEKSLNTCELYDPVVNKWSPFASMSQPRHAFSMSELNGWLYVAGGSDFINTEYNSVERYDPLRDTWEEVGSMCNKREGLVLISHDQVLYAMGGENGISILNTIEHYDHRSGLWSNCCPMGYRRRYFGAAILNDRLYSVGGSDYDEDLNTVEIFEARMNRWFPIPSMKQRRESVAVVAINNKLFAIGGACVNRELDTVEVYDPNFNKWEENGRIPTCKEGMAAVIL